MSDKKPEDTFGNMYKNFAIMIPQGPYVPPKEPFFKIWKEYSYWHLKIKMPRYPKCLDRAFKPLCKYGWHRWVGTYGFAQYWYGDIDGIGERMIKEHNFRCARCKQNKITWQYLH